MTNQNQHQNQEQEQMQQLIDQVIDWAHARNLIKGSTVYKQGLKLMSEFGELCDAIAKGDTDAIRDGIGDIAVVLIIIATMGHERLETDTKITAHSTLTLFDFGAKLADIANGYCWVSRTFYSLQVLAKDLGFDVVECLACAYDEIKERKGVMYQGVFVKESDKRYSEIVKEFGL